MDMDTAHIKLKNLKDYLKKLGKVAVAFSGGVDSTFLLMAAHQVLGENVLAITARSGLFPKKETNEAIEFTSTNGIRHIVCDINELSVDGFAQNPVNRCYLCKKSLFLTFKKLAADNGFDYLAEGSNVDDDNDYRPGMMAIKELNILSPLKAMNFKKDDIRLLSREMGLSTWKKPSFACLASRFPYGELITREKLNIIEKSEQFLFDLGFKQVRVRYHGDLAKIEVTSGEMDKLLMPDMRETVCTELKKNGFSYVAVDLQGYRTGSMNETIGK